MSRVHGKDAKYSFNAVDLDDELNTITQQATVPSAEITSFDDLWGNHLAGKKNITTDIAGSLDLASGEGHNAIFDALGGGPVSTVFDLTGNGPNTNDPEYQCTASGLSGVLVSSYSMSLGVGQPGTYAATMQHSGLTTRAVA